MVKSTTFYRSCSWRGALVIRMTTSMVSMIEAPMPMMESGFILFVLVHVERMTDDMRAGSSSGWHSLAHVKAESSLVTIAARRAHGSTGQSIGL